MKVIGIVAEYNPFHNGHAYQLRQAKERFQADAVVVVMSGNFTQRGTPAIFDKDSRAKMALSCGADLIFELPAVFSTASAQLFAKGGVSLLHATGVVDQLLFGCETEDISLFEAAADALQEESEADQALLRESLAAGNTYARARAEALSSPALADFLSTPNNLLGAEYVRALKQLNSPIRPVCLKREGSQYHDTAPAGGFISASGFRRLFYSCNGNFQEPIEAYTPKPVHKLLLEKLTACEDIYPNDVSALLHARLYETEDFSVYSDCSQALSNKIVKYRDEYVNFEQFCDLLKSRDLTLARIRRALCHILLDIKKEDAAPILFGERPPYLHILGFNETGSRLLSEIRRNADAAGIPLFLMAKEADSLLSKEAAGCFARDLYAANLYRVLLTKNTSRSYPTEYTKKYSFAADASSDGTDGCL